MVIFSYLCCVTCYVTNRIYIYAKLLHNPLIAKAMVLVVKVVVVLKVYLSKDNKNNCGTCFCSGSNEISSVCSSSNII